MKLKITDYIRFFITVILLYFIYKETGPATTIALFLVALNIEIRDILKR